MRGKLAQYQAAAKRKASPTMVDNKDAMRTWAPKICRSRIAALQNCLL